MSGDLVELGVTWWIMMGALVVSAGSLGGLLVAIAIPAIINALKEAKSMFGRKKEEPCGSVRVPMEGGGWIEYHGIPSRIASALHNVVGMLEAVPKMGSDLVDCEGCGCLIRRDKAIRGESVIEKAGGPALEGMRRYYGMPSSERIREVFWCKCCGEDV